MRKQQQPQNGAGGCGGGEDGDVPSGRRFKGISGIERRRRSLLFLSCCCCVYLSRPAHGFSTLPAPTNVRAADGFLRPPSSSSVRRPPYRRFRHRRPFGGPTSLPKFDVAAYDTFPQGAGFAPAPPSLASSKSGDGDAGAGSTTVYREDIEGQRQEGKATNSGPHGDGIIRGPLIHEADPNDYRYSASDCFHNIRSIPRSTILRSTKYPVLAVVAWSVVVSLFHMALKSLAGTAVASGMCIGSKPHSFLVSALGLLLVFRTNSAYQRFAEGRQIWERILSISRNVTRMAMLYENELSVPRRRRIFRLLAAFPYLLHHHIHPQSDPSMRNSRHGLALLRKDGSMGRGGGGRVKGFPSASHQAKSVLAASLNGGDSSLGLGEQGDSAAPVPSNTCWVDRRTLPWCLMPEPVQEIYAQMTNRPLWTCDRLCSEFNDVAYTPNFTSRERLTFLSHIDKLSQCIGECERIHQTAVPLNYARHSLRSLTLWLFTLPFALVEDFGLLTGPVMGLAAWLLFGIYQIGYQIEDPFQGSLRLSMLCDAIYRDVMYGTDFMRRRVSAFSETDEERNAWSELDAMGFPEVVNVDDTIRGP